MVHPSRIHFLTIGLLLAASLWAGLLLYGYQRGAWMQDAQGRWIANDFVNVWAAGSLVREGRAEAAYDWTMHRAAEEAVVGTFNGYYGWHYPPPLLPVAALLAGLSYGVAWLVWMLAGFIVFVIGLWRILPSPWLAIALALAWPASLWNVSVGQNGFLTAGLMALALSRIDTRPAQSGFWLGLLSYKPQLGVIFPVVLMMERRWRMMCAAALTVAAMAAVSLWFYGIGPWQAFLHWMPVTADAVLKQGVAQFSKLQTVFGAVRLFGGNAMWAYGLHAAVAVGSLMLWVRLRKQHIHGETHCAMLVTTALLSTPYLYIYDLVALAVAAAFLWRAMLRDGAMPFEMPLWLMVGLCLLVSPMLNLPLGLVAVLLTQGLAVRRSLHERAVTG